MPLPSVRRPRRTRSVTPRTARAIEAYITLPFVGSIAIDDDGARLEELVRRPTRLPCVATVGRLVDPDARLGVGGCIRLTRPGVERVARGVGRILDERPERVRAEPCRRERPAGVVGVETVLRRPDAAARGGDPDPALALVALPVDEDRLRAAGRDVVLPRESEHAGLEGHGRADRVPDEGPLLGALVAADLDVVERPLRCRRLRGCHLLGGERPLRGGFLGRLRHGVALVAALARLLLLRPAGVGIAALGDRCVPGTAEVVLRVGELGMVLRLAAPFRLHRGDEDRESRDHEHQCAERDALQPIHLKTPLALCLPCSG